MLFSIYGFVHSEEVVRSVGDLGAVPVGRLTWPCRAAWAQGPLHRQSSWRCWRLGTPAQSEPTGSERAEMNVLLALIVGQNDTGATYGPSRQRHVAGLSMTR